MQEFLHPGKLVVHNDKIPDKDAANLRQVDITVRDPLSRIVEVASECRRRADKQCSPWVEEAQGRLRSLQAERMNLVSSSGFSGPAQKKATALTSEGSPIDLLVVQDLQGDVVGALHPKPIQVRFFDRLEMSIELGTIPPKLPFPPNHEPDKLHFVNKESGDEYWPTPLLLNLLQRQGGGLTSLPRNEDCSFNVKLVDNAVSNLKAKGVDLEWDLRHIAFTGKFCYREMEVPIPKRIRYYRKNDTKEILSAIVRFEFELAGNLGAFEMIYLPHSVVQMEMKLALGHQEVQFSPVEWGVLTESVPPFERKGSQEGF